MYVLTQPVCALTRETTPSWSGFLTEINTSKYMLDEKLQSKIDLLQEQIDNLEKSGHYTDAEIQTQTKPLKIELNIIKDSLSYEFLSLQELLQLSQRIHNAIATKHSQGNGFVVKIANAFNAFLKDDQQTISSNKYGMSDEEYEAAKAKHNQLFAPLKTMNIEVIGAEILTPNHQEA